MATASDWIESLSTVHPVVFAFVAEVILDALQEENDRAVEHCNAKLGRMDSQLLQVNVHLVDVTTKHQEAMRYKAAHEACSATYASETACHEAAAVREQREVDRLRGVIRDDLQRRSNAVYDSIPLHGFFAGLISGDYKRMIPLYSQVDGIVVAIQNKLDAALLQLGRTNETLAQLRSKSTRSRDALRQTQAAIKELDSVVARLQMQVQTCERARKAMGEQLTALQGVREAVSKLRAKYASAHDQVRLLAEMDDADFQLMCLRDFQHLAQQHANALLLLQ
ncbi:hypothetical protein SPRG_12160 [Saprolegnia parasitica CBS 223.65]|uniref:Uncharacterized protein n=1 Tax=Saprolegnia parasitica (strain CBS 223.65) TaxID=695850 RepID=A0A067BWV6_SAPPC|nr:hypothetical protein SPRG_12160 [Saprolegnia parasitica CBS 223.65]KDO22733.1 hypothetical protein SPRG_12160 [Saprolegnia parasitica CBS 223.65]|eukprot:XP_012206521.1 hypothetical protein SPRG_12160 [Saprolegnia parasitica CBS 223.65]